MITKELMRTRLQGKYVRPLFVDTSDKRLLALAQNLIATYENGINMTAEELDSMCDAIIEKEKDQKLARGIVKTLRSRAVFSSSNDCDCPTERRNVFLTTASLIASENLPEDALSVRECVFGTIAANSEKSFMEDGGIYSDLPENDRLVKVSKIFPKELLERYNTGLVQGLLLMSSSFDCEISFAEERQKLRRFFKYLRFFRLLATARKDDKNILIHVDGPASILENTLKYGLQLASFFPALCQLEKWKIKSEIKHKERHVRLNLDDESGLKSHFSNLSSYRPEEIKMFADFFKTHETNWIIDDTPDFIILDNGEIIFPDFSFTNRENNEIIFLELFHKWHAGQLTKRIEYLSSHQNLKLVLGTDRSLLKNDPILKKSLENIPSFTFSAYPGSERVLKILDKR